MGSTGLLPVPGGGAGFIGADFVHATVREHAEHSVTVLDALTYAGNEASLAPVREDIESVHGSVADADLVGRLVQRCDAVVHFAAESHNDNSLRDPSPFLQTNIVGHVHGSRGGPEARGPAAPGLHRRGVRRSRARQPKQVHSQNALQPLEPLVGDQGGLGPAGAALGALLRRARDHLQLLEQLRALLARGEVHPAADHQPAQRAAAEALRCGGERPRWIHVDDHNPAVHTILEHSSTGSNPALRPTLQGPCHRTAMREAGEGRRPSAARLR